MNFIYELHQPSTNGTSSWLTYLECPRRARLSAESRAQGFSSLGSTAQQVGTITHAYLDLYHTGRLDVRDVSLIDSMCFRSWGVGSSGVNLWHTGEAISTEVLSEARRVFKAYAQIRPPDYWGSHNIAELTLGASPAEREATTGDAANDWSGRIDLLSGEQGGTYVVVDHKALSRLDANSRVSYAHSLQLKCYMLAAAAQGYEISHGIINAVIKTKEVKVEEVQVAFPNKRERDEIYAFFRHVNVIRTQRKDEVNISKCFDFWGNCPYLQSCDRIGST
jgi:hypothetical protein